MKYQEWKRHWRAFHLVLVDGKALPEACRKLKRRNQGQEKHTRKVNKEQGQTPTRVSTSYTDFICVKATHGQSCRWWIDKLLELGMHMHIPHRHACMHALSIYIHRHTHTQTHEACMSAHISASIYTHMHIQAVPCLAYLTFGFHFLEKKNFNSSGSVDCFSVVF